jgi:hypothetical protein
VRDLLLCPQQICHPERSEGPAFCPKIPANIPEATVEITQLEDAKESENSLDFVWRGRPRPRPLTLGSAACEVSKKSKEGDDRGTPSFKNRKG